MPSVSRRVSPRRRVMYDLGAGLRRSERRMPAPHRRRPAHASPSPARRCWGLASAAGSPARCRRPRRSRRLLEGAPRGQVGQGASAVPASQVGQGGAWPRAGGGRRPRPGSGPVGSVTEVPGTDGRGQRRGVEAGRGAEGDEVAGGRRPSAAARSRGRALRADPAGGEDDDAVGHALGLGQLVGGEHTQTPCSFSPATTARMARRPSGSTPAVGSSRKATSGRPTRARARERRCCSPPERCRHGVPATARSPTRSSRSSGATGSG